MGIEIVGREGAAAVLGISPSRVSQMISEDPNFPSPVLSLGKRTVWMKDVIQAYKRKREGRSTLTMHSLSLPTQPLTRVLDQVVPLTGTSPIRPVLDVYLRVWSGDITVALVEGCDERGGGSLDYAIEDFASELTRLFPQILGTADICWVCSHRSSSPYSRLELVNVVFERTLDGALIRPAWVHLEIERFVEVIGDPQVEMYPSGTLTKANVRQFQRGGGPIEITANADKISDRLETIRLIENSPLEQRDKETALDYLASSLRMVDYDATTEHTYPDSSYEESRPRTDSEFKPRWAVVRKNRPLTEDERAMITQLELPSQGNGRPFDDSRLLDLLHALHEWGESIDEYADEPNPAAYQQIRDLAGALPIFVSAEPLRRRAEKIVEEISRPFVAHLRKDEPHVQRYLEKAGAMVARARPDQQREQRILAREVASANDGTAYFGYDQFGTPFAESVDDHDRGNQGIIAVLWPREPVPLSIADHILIDGHGDTLAFIANSDRTVRALLPRVEKPSSVGWSTGYGGTGPVDLIDAICNALTAAGFRPNTQHIREAITPNTTPETVWLSIADIAELPSA